MVHIKPQKDYMVALESVAMTDIVLNMFIFFFISFSLLYTFNPERVSKIDVNLPKAQSAAALEGAEKLTITITKEGKLFLDDEEKTAEGLKSILRDKLKDNPSIGVVLKVDSLARFAVVVSALDIINELNIQKVSVAAIKQE